MAGDELRQSPQPSAGTKSRALRFSRCTSFARSNPMRIYSIARQYPFRLLLTLGAFGLTTLSDAAKAQDEVFTVFSPRQTTREQVGRDAFTGAPIEKDTVSEQVAYRDLNLSKASDVDELDRRVREAAEDVCSALDRLAFTYSGEAHRNCVTKAIKTTGEQIDAAVATANRGYGNADRP
jgi:UrcA family protein